MIPLDEAVELIQNIQLFHPYGSVGTLPYFYPINGIEFGANPSAKLLLDVAGQIKTFTDGTNPDSSEILQLRKCMEFAHKLVFLGFAFYKLNMELIVPQKIQNSPASPINCFACRSKFAPGEFVNHG